MRRRLLAALIALSAALGCGDRSRPGTSLTSPPDTPTAGEKIADVTRDRDVFLRTENLRYSLRRESTGFAVDIPFTYSNPRSDTVYLPSCRADTTPLPPVLEKEVQPGKWVRAWSADARNCLSALRPLSIGPGVTRADTLHVRAAYAADSVTAFTVAPPQGVYRLVWRVLVSYDTTAPGFGAVLPVSQRLSNRFVLDPG